METAAYSYVTEVLGVDDAILDYACCDHQGAVAHLRARGEGGRHLDQDAATIRLVSIDGTTWEIVTVTSERMAITDVSQGPTTTPDELHVSVQGDTFAGIAVLSATSSCNPEALTRVIVTLGSSDARGASDAVLPVPECDVVILQLRDEPAADGATPHFASLAFRRVDPDSS